MTTTSGTRTSGALWTAHGRGEPVTLVVHGLGATPGEARIPASGLRGTRVVVTLPGHGAADDAPPGYWTYERVASDMCAIADEVGATQAVGVSLGAGALTRIVAESPQRFDRLALLLPASLDEPRDPASVEVFEQLAQAVDSADDDDGARLRSLVGDGLPVGADVGDYVTARAQTLLRLRDALRTVPYQPPLADRQALAAVTAAALVVGAVADPLHPADVAEDLARALPDARLEPLNSAAPMLTHRTELRGLLTGLLN